jgi:hypothetical protein
MKDSWPILDIVTSADKKTNAQTASIYILGYYEHWDFGSRLPRSRFRYCINPDAANPIYQLLPTLCQISKQLRACVDCSRLIRLF